MNNTPTQYFRGIKLAYLPNRGRNNYMSLSDIAQDLTTNCLIELLKIHKKFRNQMIIVSEIERREELEENVFMGLLEDYCNGE